MLGSLGNGSTLDGVTISTGSTATVQDNTTTTLQGTLTNNGSIALNSGGNSTDLAISGTVQHHRRRRRLSMSNLTTPTTGSTAPAAR